MNQTDEIYNRIKLAFINLSEDGAYFTENPETKTLCLSLKDGMDTMSIYHIWGNNPITIVCGDEIKTVSNNPPDIAACLEPYIESWRKNKTI